MLIKYQQILFLISLMSGTLIVCSSSSWLIAWVGLEINLMSFIPLLLINLNSSSTENAIKYFLVQAMASVIIILCLMVTAMKSEMNFMVTSNNMLLISLGLKAGVAPLHFWFPQIMASMDWIQAMLLLTWQKIAPLILMISLTLSLINILIISSALLGAMMGFNQTSMKKILTFSAIMNSGWLMVISTISTSIWWLFFLIYSMIVLSVICSISHLSSTSVTDNNSISSLSIWYKIFIFVNTLSLAGIPPFTGFFIKIMILITLMKSFINLLTISSLIFSSFLAFYFYMRIMYSMLFQSSKNINIQTSPFSKNNSIIYILLCVSLMLNLLLPLMVCLS